MNQLQSIKTAVGPVYCFGNREFFHPDTSWHPWSQSLKMSNPRNGVTSASTRVMRRPGKEGMIPTKNTRSWAGGVEKIPQHSQNGMQRRPQVYLPSHTAVNLKSAS